MAKLENLNRIEEISKRINTINGILCLIAETEKKGDSVKFCDTQGCKTIIITYGNNKMLKQYITYFNNEFRRQLNREKNKLIKELENL